MPWGNYVLETYEFVIDKRNLKVSSLFDTMFYVYDVLFCCQFLLSFCLYNRNATTQREKGKSESFNISYVGVKILKSKLFYKIDHLKLSCFLPLDISMQVMVFLKFCCIYHLFSLTLSHSLFLCLPRSLCLFKPNLCWNLQHLREIAWGRSTRGGDMINILVLV